LVAKRDANSSNSAAAKSAASQTAGQKPGTENTAKPPNFGLRIAWLAMAALASLTFLAITNHLCQDIAVVPFMWVIPLSLYLLSFIICFDTERWYLRKTFVPDDCDGHVVG
jgi:hypothetical protein